MVVVDRIKPSVNNYLVSNTLQSLEKKKKKKDLHKLG